MSAMSPQIPPHLFTAIDHVGIAVSDLDAAIAFYRDTYGMRLAHEETNEEQGVREAMMGVGESGSCIQLLAPLSPESTIAKFLDRSGPGIQQLADRKSTRLNSSHMSISYAVFCLKKKKKSDQLLSHQHPAE